MKMLIPTDLPRRLLAPWLLGAALSAGAAQASDLPVATPADHGIDPGRLTALSAWLREDGLDVHSLLVIKDGKLVFERYTDGLTRDHNYELYSVTKTVTALLAGMLIEDGKITLDDDIASVIGDYRPDLAERVADMDDIELRHVLSMSSGLAYDFAPEGDPIYYGADDRLDLIADTPTRFAPGSDFEYTDVNPVFAAAMLDAASDVPLPEYAAERLFEPMGMEHYAWQRADDRGLVSAGWGLRLRPVDLAKLGMLLINHGQWQGEQLVPADWIARMTTPQAVRDFGYYLWRQHIVDTETSYDMMGFKGQFVTALPEHDTVVVMTGMLPIEGGLRHAKNVRIFRDVVNDYVLPALDAEPDGTHAPAAQEALEEELAASLASHPEPGVFVDPTDAPQR
ncbi:serine hydrolase domain-containing protein [Halomonas organivorans]|uniref:CubicO group peptidase (Beta-lactamase class C family) n=1 Tax=Halomonas organivorans TaxID=257772 RepID=A0A7W5BUB2_9GAMM|nr:serine hydrolase [Halomonas organivorans]MBB3139171.1 CubicO group peptidase (beta-lactamase class C family) [Halomonas organivorans]